jgi:hypothetical protein
MPLNGVIFIQNFLKIDQILQNLKFYTHRESMTILELVSLKK